MAYERDKQVHHNFFLTKDNLKTHRIKWYDRANSILEINVWLNTPAQCPRDPFSLGSERVVEGIWGGPRRRPAINS